MKFRIIVYVLGVSAFLIMGTATTQLLVANTIPQESGKSWDDQRRIDSLKYSKAKSDKRAKDANDAASDSKKALNSEKKAQKAREKADDQNKKASDSKDKSENNY